MEASALSAPEWVPVRRRQSGFSLVEVTLAIGIVSFAFVAIFGMLPVGYNVFRHSMDISVGSQISQQVMSELQQSDFNVVIAADPAVPTAPMPDTGGKKAIRYFDDSGTEVLNVSPSSVPVNVLYFVNTRVIPATPLLKTSASDPNNVNLATVTVQVAPNPSHRELGYSSATGTSPDRMLWNGSFAVKSSLTGRVQVQTYTSNIARNQTQ